MYSPPTPSLLRKEGAYCPPHGLCQMTLKMYCKEFKYICKTDYYHNFPPVGGNTKGGLFMLKGNIKGGIFFIVLKKVDREMIYFPVSLYSMTPFPVSPRGEKLNKLIYRILS